MCQKSLAEQASKAMFAVKSSLVNYTNISTDILFKVFDSKVQPILTYGAELWFPHSATDIEVVYSKLCKYVCSLTTLATSEHLR